MRKKVRRTINTASFTYLTHIRFAQSNSCKTKKEVMPPADCVKDNTLTPSQEPNLQRRR